MAGALRLVWARGIFEIYVRTFSELINALFGMDTLCPASSYRMWRVPG